MLGRYDDAERHYERAYAKENAIGGMLVVGDRAGFVRLLLQRDAPGDRARASAILTQLRQDMSRLGVRRNWQLDAMEALGLFGRTFAGNPIVRKPSRNRQDSKGGGD
jgi:hypothetical protein